MVSRVGVVVEVIGVSLMLVGDMVFWIGVCIDSDSEEPSVLEDMLELIDVRCPARTDFFIDIMVLK